jgi:hypothetical protein
MVFPYNFHNVTCCHDAGFGIIFYKKRVDGLTVMPIAIYKGRYGGNEEE